LLSHFVLALYYVLLSYAVQFEEFTARMFRIVAEALNLPEQRNGGAPRWDVARVRRELDRPSIDRLHGAILTMSGLSYGGVVPFPPAVDSPTLESATNAVSED
jgi:hypothetical protein